MAKRNQTVRIAFAVVAVAFLLTSACFCVFAAEPIDLSQKCSITFTMSYNGTPLTGSVLKIYRIASWAVHDGGYSFEWVSELADAGLDLRDKDSEVFARHVSMLIESRSFPAFSSMVGPSGKTTFSELDSGLYVVYQTEAPKGYEAINAFCVSLPILDEEGVHYNVQAAPKPRPEKTTVPSTVPSSDPDSPTPPDEIITEVSEPYDSDSPPIISMEDKLPQTGQLWWPTWMLGAFGAMLLGLGFLTRYLLRQNEEKTEV